MDITIMPHDLYKMTIFWPQYDTLKLIQVYLYQ